LIGVPMALGGFPPQVKTALLQFMHSFGDSLADPLGRACVICPPLVVEFPGKSPYDSYADEFVRLGCRDDAGWRRDEWA
jgi:hypothetical protein